MKKMKKIQKYKKNDAYTEKIIHKNKILSFQIKIRRQNHRVVMKKVNIKEEKIFYKTKKIIMKKIIIKRPFLRHK